MGAPSSTQGSAILPTSGSNAKRGGGSRSGGGSVSEREARSGADLYCWGGQKRIPGGDARAAEQGQTHAQEDARHD